MKFKINLKNNAVWLMLIGLVAIFSFLTPNFFTNSNFMTILRQVANTGILSMAMTFVLLSGGIDLSIGNQMGLVGVIAALMMVTLKVPIVLACIIGIVVGILVGLINGLVITYTKLPPLICTLGMAFVAKGLAYIVTGGLPVYGLPKEIKILGQGYIAKIIPVSVMVMVLVILAGAFILNKTHIGRQFYAIGSNEEAARLSGLNVYKIRILVYTLSGALAGLSGIVMMSRVNSGQPLSGNGMEMDALIACVVGGISISGGEGRVFGMIGGMLVMGVLSNGMAVMGLTEYFQMVIKGLVLIAVVGIDCWQRSRIKKAKIAGSN